MKLKKYKKIYKIISNILFYIKATYFYIFLTIFKIFKIRPNKVIFISFFGKGFGDNGKYITEKLLEQSNDINIYWCTHKKFKNSLPNRVNYCRYGSIIYLYHLATSKIWINNSRFDYGIIKRKEQYYIQTWHSSLRLKVIEKDAEEMLNKNYIKSAKRDSKMCNLIISGSRISTEIYKNSFWYDGRVLETGTPRCDIFFDNETIDKCNKKIHNKFNINLEKKIVLFAPTFRNNSDITKIDFNELESELGEEYSILVRFHPKVNVDIQNDKNILNVTNYPDIQELICACDYFVTDYSGCCFDAMYANKPIILYVPDIEQYKERERKLYFKVEELPFIKVKNEEELVNSMLKFDKISYFEGIQDFNDKIGLVEDGKAANKVAEIIINIIKGENNEKI